MAKKANKKKAESAVKKTAKKKQAVVEKATRKTTKKKVVNKSKKVTKKKASGSTPKRTILRKISQKKKISRVSRRRKSTLTKDELKFYRNLLIEKLTELLGDVKQFELESLKKSRLDASGDLSSMPIHMADIGSDNYEQEFVLGLMDSERKIVQEILAALRRIEAGVYGICEGTGEPIPKPRLAGIPWTRYCVNYAEMIEKGLANEDDNRFSFEGGDQSEDDKSSEDDAEEEFDGEDDEDQDEEDDRDPFYYQFADEDADADTDDNELL